MAGGVLSCANGESPLRTWPLVLEWTPCTSPYSEPPAGSAASRMIDDLSLRPAGTALSRPDQFGTPRACRRTRRSDACTHAAGEGLERPHRGPRRLRTRTVSCDAVDVESRHARSVAWRTRLGRHAGTVSTPRGLPYGGAAVLRNPDALEELVGRVPSQDRRAPLSDRRRGLSTQSRRLQPTSHRGVVDGLECRGRADLASREARSMPAARSCAAASTIAAFLV